MYNMYCVGVTFYGVCVSMDQPICLIVTLHCMHQPISDGDLLLPWMLCFLNLIKIALSSIYILLLNKFHSSTMCIKHSSIQRAYAWNCSFFISIIHDIAFHFIFSAVSGILHEKISKCITLAMTTSSHWFVILDVKLLVVEIIWD